MKKYTLVTIILMLFLATVLTGCEGKFGEYTEDLKTELESELSAGSISDFEDLTQEEIDAAPLLEDLTKKELATADIKTIKTICAKNLGSDFRSFFSIDATTDLKDEDWENIRGLLYFQLFQTFIYVDEDGNEHLLINTDNEKQQLDQAKQQKEAFEKEKEEIRTNIEEMTKEEFVGFLCESTADDLKLNDEEKEQYKETLLTLSDEEITELKESTIQKLISLLEEEYYGDEHEH